MTVFFEHVLFGNDEQKVEYFKQLTDKNEKLCQLVIKKDARIYEYNGILDFLGDFTDEEV